MINRKTQPNLLFIILSLLLIFGNHEVRGQATVTPNAPVSNLEYLGWSNSVIDLDFKTGGTLYMRLMATGGSPGFFGIGQSIAASNPLFQLDVDDDVNLNPGTFPNFGYRWLGDIILKTDNTGANIYLGLGAGDASSGGTANTYLGVDAGNANNTSGGGNTFVGWTAGGIGNSADESTFIGSRAGESSNGTSNCYFGMSSGRAGNHASLNNGNSFFGHASGESNDASLNTFIGSTSGNGNINGRFNTFLGALTGDISDASDSVFLGYSSGGSNTTGTRNTFAGEPNWSWMVTGLSQ